MSRGRRHPFVVLVTRSAGRAASRRTAAVHVMPGELHRVIAYVRRMQLAVHESGTGRRTAILIHGIMSDSRAWHRVTAELEAQGFRVLAVDLSRARTQPPRAQVLAGGLGRRRGRDPRAAARRPARRGHGPLARRARREPRRRSPGAARGDLHRPRLRVPVGHQGLGVQGVLRDRTPAEAVGARAHEPEVERRRRRHRARDAARLGQAHDPRLPDTRPLVPPVRLVAPSLVRARREEPAHHGAGRRAAASPGHDRRDGRRAPATRCSATITPDSWTP